MKSYEMSRHPSVTVNRVNTESFGNLDKVKEDLFGSVLDETSEDFLYVISSANAKVAVGSINIIKIKINNKKAEGLLEAIKRNNVSAHPNLRETIKRARDVNLKFSVGNDLNSKIDEKLSFDILSNGHLINDDYLKLNRICFIDGLSNPTKSLIDKKNKDERRKSFSAYFKSVEKMYNSDRKEAEAASKLLNTSDEELLSIYSAYLSKV